MGLETPSFIDDFVITNPVSGDPRSEGDDHLRNIKTAIKATFPGLAGRSWRIQSKSSGYTVVAADNMSVIKCTAALTLALTAAATLGNGHLFLVSADGGDVTLDANSTETINTSLTAVVPDGAMAAVFCDGSNFICFQVSRQAGTLSPTALSANQDDYAPTGFATAQVLRLSSDASRNITGLSATNNKGQKRIYNVGTFPIVFTYEDTASAAGNRFAFGCTLGGGQSMVIEYDLTSSRWRASQLPEAIGTIKDHGGTSAPAGYLACDGAAVSRTTYASLFNIVGTTWGVGDGSSTFNVPNFQRRVAVGSGGSGTATLANSVGSVGGAETHTLTTPEIPAHTHSYTQAGATAGPLDLSSGTSQPGTVNTGSTGGGGAHNNMQPSAVVLKIIKY